MNKKQIITHAYYFLTTNICTANSTENNDSDNHNTKSPLL